MTNRAWTKLDIEQLRELYRSGATHSEIGAQIERSRNAVIGKVHRLGLHTDGYEKGYRSVPMSGRHSAVSDMKHRPKKKRRHPFREFRALPPQEDSKPLEPLAVLTMRGCSLIDLTSKTCRFPVGDPQEQGFFYCGNDTMAGYPYCAYHARLSYVTPAEARAAQRRRQANG